MRHSLAPVRPWRVRSQQGEPGCARAPHSRASPFPPPRAWTPDKLWNAYELLHKDKVRGASSKRILTDIVSLIRFALHRDDELIPHAERVKARFENWIAQQNNTGRKFSAEQSAWLQMIRDHVAASWEL